MTPTKLDISRLCRFPPILGKWENGEGKGKIGDYLAFWGRLLVLHFAKYATIRPYRTRNWNYDY
ncbi:hypothetical protein B0189_10905 [Moraxella cuniculi]|nr:hypothetical protein B0189_10905 [Moraxella cuniculi]